MCDFSLTNSLDAEALAQQQLIHQGHKVVLHVTSMPVIKWSPCCQSCCIISIGDVVLIAKHLALEASSQCRQGTVVVDVGGRDPQRHDLALAIDPQMSLSPKSQPMELRPHWAIPLNTLCCLPRAL